MVSHHVGHDHEELYIVIYGVVDMEVEGDDAVVEDDL